MTVATNWRNLSLWMSESGINSDYIDWQDRRGDQYTFTLYTESHYYSITFTDSYLGCTVSTRKPRVGERHNRSNDLADGSFCLQTWNEILSDIVRYELLQLESTTRLAEPIFTPNVEATEANVSSPVSTERHRTETMSVVGTRQASGPLAEISADFMQRYLERYNCDREDNSRSNSEALNGETIGWVD